MRNLIPHPPCFDLFSKAGIAEYQSVDPDPAMQLARPRDYGDSLLNSVTDSPVKKKPCSRPSGYAPVRH
jgi:hypothetical protein